MKNKEYPHVYEVVGRKKTVVRFWSGAGSHAGNMGDSLAITFRI